MARLPMMEPHIDGPYQRPVPSPPPPPGVRTYLDQVFATVRGYRPLRLDLRVPAGPGPWPLVVEIHGGAWWEGSRRRPPEVAEAVGFERRVLDRGYAVANVDYRLSREAPFPAQLHDVKAALRWLRAFAGVLDLDPQRFAAWGDSAGGHLAALAALTSADAGDLTGEIGVTGVSSAVQAVVSWYGVATLTGHLPDEPALPPAETPPAWLLGEAAGDRAAAERASPVSHAHPAAPPFLCVHGTADDVVPYVHSELLAAALREHGVRCDLRPVPSAGHGFEPSQARDLIDASLDFLDEVFGRRAPEEATVATLP